MTFNCGIRSQKTKKACGEKFSDLRELLSHIYRIHTAKHVDFTEKPKI